MSCDSSYSIKTDTGQVVLKIEQHKTSAGVVSGNAESNPSLSETQLVQTSSIRKEMQRHPWAEILQQSSSSTHPTHKPAQEDSLESECNGSKHSVSQCTTADTFTEPTTTMENAYSVPADTLMVDSIVDEITTQGLFDGLEELYDFTDTRPERCTAHVEYSSYSADCRCESGSDTPGSTAVSKEDGASIPGGSTRQHNDSASLQSHDKGGGQLNVEFGVSLGKDPTLSDRIGALEKEGLADMGEDIANEILGVFGGFSAPSLSGNTASKAKPADLHLAASAACSGPSKSNTSEMPAGKVEDSEGGIQKNEGGKVEELADMSDTEAHKILGKMGGFAKPRATAKASGSAVSKSQSFESGLNKESHQQQFSSSVYAPITSDIAELIPVDIEEPATQKKLISFPSKKDVLSARRALRTDGGKAATVAFNSPNRIVGPGQTVQEGPKSQYQLNFKSPGLKRHAAQSQFNSPSKRLLARKEASGSSNGDNKGNGMLRKSPASMFQPCKPFRAPARVSSPALTSLHQSLSKPLPVSRKVADKKSVVSTLNCSLKTDSDDP